MNITQEQFTQLINVYNTLLTINTKGEDTLLMADCVRAMQLALRQVQEANSSVAADAASGQGDE